MGAGWELPLFCPGANCPTNSTSGAFVPRAELRSGSRRRRIGSRTRSCWIARTLLYLAGDPDGSGQSMYSMDVERRIPHRLTSGLDRYTSLAATEDGRRLVVTRTTPHGTLFRIRIGDLPAEVSPADQIPLTTSSGFSPRLGPDYLLYVSATGTGESVWKLAGGASTELWRGEGARVFGGPAISPDGRWIAFSARQNGKALLYVMQADGINAHICGGLAGSAGRARVVARWSIAGDGGRRSRRPASLPRFAGRWRAFFVRRATIRWTRRGRPTATWWCTQGLTSAPRSR